MALPIETHSLAFDPANARAALSQLPATSAVFALYGAESHFDPYIGRTPNLRGRLERLLQPSAKHPRRLQLAGLVRRIEWRPTGSDFESLLVQFELLEKVYGAKCLERMHLRQSAFVRFLGGNAFPRIAVTYRPCRREAQWAYGPFPSRTAAERFVDETLKLFLLRRCTEELIPDPAHPGCVYSEMKRCLAPCCQGCSAERYAEEAAAVEQFLATRGQSRLDALCAERDEASAKLEFETAAALHAQVEHVESVRALASELVRPLSQLRAVILQASAKPDEVAVFLYENGLLRGPAGFSILGMRIQNEHSGSTSLFAQPVAIEAIPETGSIEQPAEKLDSLSGTDFREGTGSSPYMMSNNALTTEALAAEGDSSKSASASTAASDANPVEAASVISAKLSRGLLEARMEAALAILAEPARSPSSTLRQGHLALVKRWYYRPEARRRGEIFFPDAEGCWPVKAMLRGVGRVFASGFKPSSSFFEKSIGIPKMPERHD
jgi:excinuclease ABC subunit C